MPDSRTLGPPETPLELAQHAELLELESQIRSLNTKISAAVDHAADLQDEIRSMRARQRDEVAAQEALANESSLRRMSTYFSRRGSPGPVPRSNSMSPSKQISTRNDDEDDLPAKLKRETRMRMDLETKYKSLQDESETLSQSLFEEANKMVSTEKKLTHAATIKLQAMQDREMERKRRLEELENAVGRIQRVRGVLNDNLSQPKAAVQQ